MFIDFFTSFVCGVVDRFKNNKELRNGRFVHSTDGNVITMTINDTEVNDLGVYRCEASNKLGHVDTQCNVEVHSMYYMF